MAETAQTSNSFEDFNDALIAAHRESRRTDRECYAVQWPLGHSTIEVRKPSLRTQQMRVICCINGREELA